MFFFNDNKKDSGTLLDFIIGRHSYSLLDFELPEEEEKHVNYEEFFFNSSSRSWREFKRWLEEKYWENS